MKVYAYINKKAQIVASSSGGAFYGITETFYKYMNDIPHVIYGAEYTSDMKVKHNNTTDMKQVTRFCGSKYVASKLGNTYSLVAMNLFRNEYVLFSGTPCQINGLLNYLKKNDINTDKLYTIEVICHGTLRQNIWDDYRKWLEDKHKSKIKEFSFRYKKLGWRGYPTYALFENGEEEKNTYAVRVITRLFLSKLGMNEVCFECKFKNTRRNADITLGDFWDVNSYIAQIPRNNGVSLMITNSSKGDSLICSMFDSKIENESYFEEIINYNYDKNINLNSNYAKPNNYEAFWKVMETDGFELAIKKFCMYRFKGHCKYLLFNGVSNVKKMFIEE